MRRAGSLLLVTILLVLGLAAGDRAAAAPPPDPLPWRRSYVSEVPVSPDQFVAELFGTCNQDALGVRSNGATGAGHLAILGDSITNQLRNTVLADSAYRWTVGSRCNESFGTSLGDGRTAGVMATSPDVVVIALGTANMSRDFAVSPANLAPALAELQQLLDATEGAPCRVVVSLQPFAPFHAGADAGAWEYITANLNQAFRNAAATRRNVHVADWAARIADDPLSYLQDTLHLSRKGINARINLMIETARQCFPPDTPASIGAVAGNGTTTVWWPPLPDAERSSYVVTTSDGRTIPTTQPTVNVGGLTNGTAYQFRVAAVNASGTSTPTPWTSPVTPSAAGARFHSVAPFRVLDTRDGTGGRLGPLWPSDTYKLSLAGAAPPGASAVVLNVTATSPTHPTFVTVWPGDQSRPLTSNLNPAPGIIATPSLVTTRLGADGTIALFNNAGFVHLVADVVGWFGAPGDPSGALHATTAPTRVLDTRDGTGGKSSPFTGQQSYALSLAGVLPSGASAAVLNVTGTNAAGATHLTLWPTGQSRPLASTLNPQAGITRANLTIARLNGARSVSIFNNASSTDLVIDVVGYFTAAGAPTGGATYYPITPERAFDTRDATGGIGGPIGNGGPLVLPFGGRGALPSGPALSAVDANLTVLGAPVPGHSTVWPAGTQQPLASNLNYRAADVVANRADMALTNGGASIRSNAPAVHYVVDVAGWYGQPS